MYKGLSIVASAVLILNPFSLPALAAQNLGSPANFVPNSESLPLLAQSSREQRITFATGASSASVRGAVVRATTETYILDASQGQTMSIAIYTNPIDRAEAYFEVMSPSGEIINKSGGSQTFRRSLAQSGDYRIIVRGGPGNVSFDLTVSID